MTNYTLKTHSQPEIYGGKLTGFTVWHTECERDQSLLFGLSSVLGRGYSAESSKADWLRRATNDTDYGPIGRNHGIDA